METACRTPAANNSTTSFAMVVEEEVDVPDAGFLLSEGLSHTSNKQGFRIAQFCLTY